MRLYLAVAVLMLAFVAYAEAEGEDTIGERLSNFGQTVADMSQQAFAKSRETAQTVFENEHVVIVREYVQDALEKLLQKFQDLSN
ncbi:apolipoprotein C-I [Brachionichthys hirsutus]|uniref:apolipoprotein C-I n=1 Tax=Brachionichthys hirsutus TaxID=412623 RepID=UPI00360479AC